MKRWFVIAALLVAACTQKESAPPAQPTPASQPARPTSRPSAAPPPLEQLAREHTVLLVTHPMPHVLRAFQGIVGSGALKLKQGKPLAVVGIRHADERESYRKSAALARRLPWLHLRTLRCPLGPDRLYQENGCTARFRALFQSSSGEVFTGGADLPPRLYGQKTRLTTVIATPLRQYWEVSLLAHLLGTSRNKELKPLLTERPGYAVLGICMGLQGMNVATGGTLHQDILSELYRIDTFEDARDRLKPPQLHRNPLRYLDPAPGVRPGVFHPLRFSGASKLWQALGADRQVQVMSIHHQAVDRPGQDLEVIATSSDGKVVEAMRHKRFPHVLGVQFHPEYYYLTVEKSFVAPAAQVRDPRTVAFHRDFWETFAGWLAKE